MVHLSELHQRVAKSRLYHGYILGDRPTWIPPPISSANTWVVLAVSLVEDLSTIEASLTRIPALSPASFPPFDSRTYSRSRTSLCGRAVGEVTGDPGTRCLGAALGGLVECGHRSLVNRSIDKTWGYPVSMISFSRLSPSQPYDHQLVDPPSATRSLPIQSR